jgi:hypothetical protein
MLEELDLEAETVRRDLRIVHVGFTREELRLVLADAAGMGSLLVVELKGVHSFFDRGAVGCGVVVASVVPPGSFGWHFSAAERDRHKEVYFNPKSDLRRNVFRALARTVIVRRGDVEDTNFPG